MSEEEPVSVPVDQAIERLAVIPDYDPGDGPKPCVHTFRGGSGMMLGAHWSVAAARAVMERYGVKESGPMATAMRHGLVVTDDTGPVFFETAEAGG